MNIQNKIMNVALKEAKKAFKKGEVPVGAVIIKGNKIISKAHNQKERKKNATMHAEIIAISKASKKLKQWRLDDCELYVTLEPCMMCSGAVIHSRIKKVYFGVTSEKFGFLEQNNKWFENNKNNHQVEVEKGFLEEQIIELLKVFFESKRK